MNWIKSNWAIILFWIVTIIVFIIFSNVVSHCKTINVTHDMTLDYVNGVTAPGDTVLFGPGIWHGSITPPRHTTYDKWTFYIGDSTTICAGQRLEGWVPYIDNIYYAYITPAQYGSFVVGTIDELLLKPASTPDNLPAGYYYRADGDKIYVHLKDDKDPRFEYMVIGEYIRGAIHFRQPTNQVKFENLDLKFGCIADVVWDDFDGRTDSIWFYNLDMTHAGGDWGSNHGGISTSGGLNDADSSTFSTWILVDSCRFTNMMGEAYPQDLSHAICTYGTNRFIVKNCEIYGEGIGNAIYFKDRGMQGIHYGHVAKNNYIHDIGGYGIITQSHFYKDSIYGNIIDNAFAGIVNFGSNSSPIYGYTFVAHNTVNNVKCKGIMVTHQSTYKWCGENNEIIGNIVSNSDVNRCEEDNEIVGFEYVTDESCVDSYEWFDNLYWNNNGAYRFPGYYGNDINMWNTKFGPDYEYNPLFDTAFTRPHSLPECDRWINKQHYTLRGAWQPYDTCTPPPDTIIPPPPDSSWIVTDTIWYSPIILDAPIDRGDVNESGYMDIDDAMAVINYMFGQASRPAIITKITRGCEKVITYTRIHGIVDSTISTSCFNRNEE